MVIKIDKLHIFLLLSVLVITSFLFAISEKKTIETASTTTSAKLPIIMYHHVTEREDKAGIYTVTKEEFENDLIYIKSKGYTTITVNDLIRYINFESDLPNKSIMITFDDGFESFYSYVFPLLKEYDMRAVLSVIGYTVDKYSLIDDHNLNYSNLTWAQVKVLNDSSLVEIGNHTYNLHDIVTGGRKGMAKITNEDINEYQNILTNDLLRLQNLLLKNIGKKATVIAYPYGEYSEATTEIIKELGFSASFTCESRINTITKGNANCLYNLGRYNRPSGISSEDFFEDIMGLLH